MTATRSVPGAFAEDHCALDWQLMTAGLYAPIIAISLDAAALAAGVPALTWVALAILCLTTAWWASGSGAWLRYFWPAGIRLDSVGVRIGGVGRADRGKVSARQAIVPRQYSQVFSCPWSGVLGIGVTTDHDVLRRLRRHAYRGRRLTPLGNLATPFMRAALVIWVEIRTRPSCRRSARPTPCSGRVTWHQGSTSRSGSCRPGVLRNLPRPCPCCRYQAALSWTRPS